jgi:hypothetical protein
MRRGIRTIPIRKRIFFGCEGESEQSYGALLQRIANDQQTPGVFLDVHVLKGGDPLAIVEAAIQKEREQTRKHGNFALRALLLDQDKLGQLRARDDQIPARVASAQFILVWQRPCFEAMLLHHLPGCQALRPATTALANAAIQQHWPGFHKPMSGQLLATRIGMAEVRLAASVEPELQLFLTLAGF